MDWSRNQQPSLNSLPELMIEQFTGLTAATVGLPLSDTLDISDSFDRSELIMVVAVGWVVSVWSGVVVRRRDRGVAHVDDVIQGYLTVCLLTHLV